MTLMQAYARIADRQGAAAASEVLRAQPKPDAFCYNVVVGAWADLGLHDEALGFLALMRRADYRPSRYTFPLLTQTCASLVQLGAIHGLVIRAGYASDASVATAVLRAYGRLGLLGDTRAVFDGIEAVDDVVYAAIITTCTENGDGVAALSMFGRSKTNSISGSGVISSSLKACCESSGGLLCGQWIHGYAVRTGLASESCVSSCLISLYLELGDSNDAYQVFVETPERDVVAWNAMIRAFACNGFEEEAFRVFMEMVSGHEKPTAGTLVGVIKARCVLENVKMVLPYSLKSGIGEDASVQTLVFSALRLMLVEAPKTALTQPGRYLPWDPGGIFGIRLPERRVPLLWELRLLEPTMHRAVFVFSMGFVGHAEMGRTLGLENNRTRVRSCKAGWSSSLLTWIQAQPEWVRAWVSLGF